MKVKMLVAFERPVNPFAVGQVVDVPEQLGVLYIQAGYAVAVAGEVHADPNLPEPVSVVAPEPEPEPEMEPTPEPAPPVRQAAGKPKD